MSIIKRLLFLGSLIVFYFLVKEALSMYFYLHAVKPVYAYLFVAAGFLIVIYFGVIPVIQILRLPVSIPPAKNIDKRLETINLRLKSFRKNPLLKDFDFDSSITPDEKYNQAVAVLSRHTAETRKKYIANLFYSTAISQKGFIDAILIFTVSVNLVKRIFIIYNGRVSKRDLFTIAKKIYFSIAIGGSEAVEYSSDEIFSKVASDSIKGIPFADKVLGSLADGFINAALVTRVSLITENYCRLPYISADRELYPGPELVFETTKHITKDIRDKLLGLARKVLITDKIAALNPLRYIMKHAPAQAMLDADSNLIITDEPAKSSLTNLFKRKL